MRHRKISTIMTPGSDVVQVSPDTPYKEIARLLTSHGVSAVPVVDDQGRVVGVVSEADLMAKESHKEAHKTPLLAGHRERDLETKAAGMTAAELMTSPAVTIAADADVVRAARLMEGRGVKRLPVVDEQGHLAGIVSRRDLIGVFLRSDEEIRSEITEEVVLGALWIDPGSLTVSVADGVVTVRGEVETWSVADMICRLALRVDGVVEVLDELTFARDDRHDRPAPSRYSDTFQHRYTGA